MDKLCRNMLRLGWPDVILQPLHQRQIVGETAQQAHCGMGMQIDESRNQHVLIQALALAWRKALRHLDLREEVDDAAVIDDHCVIFENQIGRINGNDPARLDGQVDWRQGHGH
ncbi:MAG: hypothetical protein AW09_003886 [Candidatus Accumulibacter phosphatis]|uniref:Uncharacterized protein n=1 Tax=Candidatus Accumulibacter phosphatis TaxID=327160 RepID=A0A080LRV7_9PROT|nr:MAG: hypothetical protein AW09_003886 [Candidatus Accumulibacter phosphatis]